MYLRKPHRKHIIALYIFTQQMIWKKKRNKHAKTTRNKRE